MQKFKSILKNIGTRLTTMPKRTIACVLVLTMIITALPLSGVVANAEGEVIQDITNTGLQFSTENPAPTVETTYKAGDGTVVWTPADTDGTVTMTFNDASVSSSLDTIDINNSFSKVNLVFNGNNTIKSSSNTALAVISEAKIEVKGSLYCEGYFNGIFSQQNITISGGNITAISTSVDTNNGNYCGIFSRGDINIISGNITALNYANNGLSAPIEVINENITISGTANVNAIAFGNCVAIRTSVYLNTQNKRNLTIDTTGRVYANGVFGIYADCGILTIKNGTVVAKGKTNSIRSREMSPYGGSDIPVITGGDVTILGAQANTIQLDGGDLTNASTAGFKYIKDETELTLAPGETTKTAVSTKTPTPNFSSNQLSGTQKTESFTTDVVNKDEYISPTFKVYSSFDSTEPATGVISTYTNGQIALSFDAIPETYDIYYVTLTDGTAEESDKATIVMSVAKYYDVTKNITGLNFTGDDSIVEGNDYMGIFSVSDLGELPPTITVQVGDVTLADTDYTYSSETGTLTIPKDKITSNITITANVVIPAPIYTVTIPAEINFGDVKRVLPNKQESEKIVKTNFEVKAEYSNLFANNKKLDVTVDASTLEIVNSLSDKLNYKLFFENDTEISGKTNCLNINLSENDVNQTTTTKLYATLDQSLISAEGAYTGTITFIVSLDDIA